MLRQQSPSRSLESRPAASSSSRPSPESWASRWPSSGSCCGGDLPGVRPRDGKGYSHTSSFDGRVRHARTPPSRGRGGTRVPGEHRPRVPRAIDARGPADGHGQDRHRRDGDRRRPPAAGRSNPLPRADEAPRRAARGLDAERARGRPHHVVHRRGDRPGAPGAPVAGEKDHRLDAPGHPERPARGTHLSRRRQPDRLRRSPSRGRRLRVRRRRGRVQGRPRPAGAGMTASPGSSAEKILEVCGNLGISAVEIRTEYDPDVVPYQHDLQIEGIKVEAPDVSKEIRKLLQTVVDEQVARLKKLGFLAGKAKVTRKDLLAVGNEARARLDSGVKDGRLYGAMTAQAIAMKADHAIELAETQGLGSLRLYFGNIEKDPKTKADVQFLKHAKVQEAIQLAEATEVEHPKLAKTGWIVRKQFMEKPDSKIIVFAHYRQTADRITQELARIPSVRPMRFVGQASRGEDIGLSQKEQVDILDKFRAGDVNVLVATSIGEEGLDIPQVDLVVFYEPVPSEIRTIQRRGRTGRSAAGRVVMLVTKDTRDEAYFYSARRKERKMHVELDRLRKDLKQKIFVGEPGGETFVAAAPEKRIETLRAQSHDRAPIPESRRRTSKKGQTTFEDY